MLQPHIDRRELRKVLPQWNGDALPSYVVFMLFYPLNRHLSNKVCALVDWTAALIANNEHMRRGYARLTLGQQSPRLGRGEGLDGLSPRDGSAQGSSTWSSSTGNRALVAPPSTTASACVMRAVASAHDN
jgi:hypothetical protein